MQNKALVIAASIALTIAMFSNADAQSIIFENSEYSEYIAYEAVVWVAPATAQYAAMPVAPPYVWPAESSLPAHGAVHKVAGSAVSQPATRNANVIRGEIIEVNPASSGSSGRVVPVAIPQHTVSAFSRAPIVMPIQQPVIQQPVIQQPVCLSGG